MIQMVRRSPPRLACTSLQQAGTHVRNPLKYAALLVRFRLWRDTELEEP